MTAINSVQMSSYELPLPAGEAVTGKEVDRVSGASLPVSLLLKNVFWFCHLRWIVIGILGGFGVLCLVSDVVQRIGLRPQAHWLLALAGVLTIGNFCFLAHARLLMQSASSHSAGINLWTQIILDLLILTAMIHFVGSLETYASFAYLFHIVLACIFFSRAQSFVVTLLSCGLYTACIAFEETGIVTPASIYAETSLGRRVELTAGAPFLNFASALAVWLVVWYLASHLSAIVRDRDNELAKTNRRLVEVQEERSRHMLHTTHELKTPFAGIHANAQLLLEGHCGVLPDEALDVVRRIAARCNRLASEIQEMLQLANLRSVGQEPPPPVEVDLDQVLRWSMAQVRPMAEERGIVFEHELQPSCIAAVEDHLRMLFVNLLSNAITYSDKGGRVRVQCSNFPTGPPVVTIDDDGIGISAEKMPRIFDEYYRTDEAVRHNRESSGLGLAIVRDVARSHGIRVRVASRPGVGTKFELEFPAKGPVPGTAMTEGGEKWLT